MTVLTMLLALLAIPVGFGAGRLVRGAFPWTRTSATVLLLATLLPWYAFHGRILNALRFGAVQSQWTHPAAFDWVHGVGYLVATGAAIVAGLGATRTRWALVFAPGLAFLGTLFVTVPMARAAVAEGYFLLSDASTDAYWIGTIAGTALLLGYSRQLAGFAPDSLPPTGCDGERPT